MHGRHADIFVGQVEAFSRQGVAQQRKVTVRISHRQEGLLLGQADGVDLCGGGFQQCEAIFELIRLFQRLSWSGEALHQGNGAGTFGAACVQETQQSRRARYERLAYAHRMGEIEQTALKPAIMSAWPRGIERASGHPEISVNGGRRSSVQRTADVVALHQAPRFHEDRVIISHTVLICHGAHQGCEAERHIVTKMYRMIADQQRLQSSWGTEMKWVK